MSCCLGSSSRLEGFKSLCTTIRECRKETPESSMRIKVWHIPSLSGFFFSNLRLWPLSKQ